MATRNLHDLEDYVGMKHLEDYEISLKQKIVKDADVMLQEVLKEYQKLDFSKLTDEELLAAMKNIKTDLESKNNPFVTGLLNN